MHLVLEARPLDPARGSLEVVERKGPGHPDTLCDAAAEAFSRRLSRYYLERTGRILHHNVDKALLVAGETRATFGGGRWRESIEVVLAGRATTRIGRERVPVEELGAAAVREALSAVRRLDPRRVRIRVAVHSGAAELREVYERGAPEVPLANDTSIGVGFAPFTGPEALALAIERRLLAAARAGGSAAAFGEDLKVMVVRDRAHLAVTLAVAMIASEVPHERAYAAAVRTARSVALRTARSAGYEDVEVVVNAADRPGQSWYLTVSGTSAECGDDGQVGRGNRYAGLITPCRPMTLEAFAGKNPCTHVGKLLSVTATRVAERCGALGGVRAAEGMLVSAIGRPVAEPQLAGVRLDLPERRLRSIAPTARAIVAEELAALPGLWRELIAFEPSARSGARRKR